MSFPWEIPPENIIRKKKLGSGNFGKVYKGECNRIKVAIKVPRIQDLDDEELAAIRQEVQIWSTKPHPNIVQFIGACTQPNNFQIVTELLEGDLEQLVHSNAQLSMMEIMDMAYQMALGMTWLHRSVPQIIHRDLKTANVLYKKNGDGSYAIKLADFGLAQIKPKALTELRDPKDGARGTPLYMPPEVLLGRPFNEKADVYSFGICLWEMVERQDPFSHHTDFDEFKVSVAVHHERPPFSDKFDKQLQVLMTKCWAPNPDDRPDFNVICQDLLPIIVRSAVADREGRKFWINNFLEKRTVPWKKFAAAFYSHFDLQLPTNKLHLLDVLSKKQRKRSASKKKRRGTNKKKKPVDEKVLIVNLRCLRAVFEDSKDSGTVSLVWFGAVLKWFGPIKKHAADDHTILDEIRTMLAYPWFHGNIDAGEAGRRLKGLPRGTFLVRFSLSVPGSYTITRIVEGERACNSRISYVPGKGFHVPGTGKKVYYESLTSLIRSLRNTLDLRAACGSSQYVHLFEVEEESDDEKPDNAYEPLMTTG